MKMTNTVTVNGRNYKWPANPLVVICCDGSEPSYMELAMAGGLMPHLKAIIGKGENFRGAAVIPSFTNPNNLSIVTGTLPEVHGICGNYLIRAARQTPKGLPSDFWTMHDSTPRCGHDRR